MKISHHPRMPTYRISETLRVEAPYGRVNAVFPEFWRRNIATPLNRPFAGTQPVRSGEGVYRQIKQTGKHDRVETTITLRPAGSQTEVTYERVWHTLLPLGPLGAPFTRRMWAGLFRTWNGALGDYLQSSLRGIA